jgi:hypothetical protein
MGHHAAALRSGLLKFMVGIEERKTSEAQSNYVNKHLHTVEDGALSGCLNEKHCHYLLPIAGPALEQDNKEQENGRIILCRSAIVELTRDYLGWNWADAEAVFPSVAAIRRSVKKRRILQIVSYLLERNFEPGRKKVCWRHASFKTLCIPEATAMKYVTDYKLRQVVSRHIHRIDHHRAWVSGTFRGLVVDLPFQLVQEGIPLIADRGYACTGYTKVNSKSIGENSKLKPKRVQYRPVDKLSAVDKVTREQIKNFESPIARAINVGTDQFALEAAFLQSLGYAVQCPHYDYNEDVLEDHADRIFLGLTPLTSAGSYLQVWPPNNGGQPGHVLYIPYGVLLILPGDTVHGGGFLSDFKSLDLRLHFYIYVRPAVGVINENRYQPDSEFPMSRELVKKGLLDRLFTADEPAGTS